jgi:apolipoprotein N-acyltransferase
VVQVSTSGMSAIIDPNGRIVARSGALYTADRIVAPVGLETSDTLATRVGAWPELVLSVLAALAVLTTVLIDRNRGRSRGTDEPVGGPPTEDEELVDA